MYLPVFVEAPGRVLNPSDTAIRHGWPLGGGIPEREGGGLRGTIGI